MKLLLDQNLSYRLVRPLAEVFPGSSQVSLLEMGNASDKYIWEYAKKENFSIVTLDADFQEYSLLYQSPPLVIWLRCGNQPRQIILEKLLQHQEIIKQAANDESVWCVEVY